MASYYRRRFCSFHCRPRFHYFNFSRFPRGPQTKDSHPRKSSSAGKDRGGNSFPLAEKRHRQSRRSSSLFFVPDFRNSKKIRRPSRYFEPKTYQCVHPTATLQDGVSRGSASPAPQGRLGSHVGSAGCLPACSHPSFLQTPSLFRLQGSGVSVSSTPIRSERLTLGLYQTSCGSYSLAPSVRYSNHSLPGRLLVGRELQVPPGAAPSEDSRAHSTVGLPSEFGEVFPDSLSNSVLSGSFFRHSEASGTPPTPQSSGVAISGAGDHSSLVLSRQYLAGVPWSPSQCHGFDSSVQVIHAPSSTSLPEVLFSAQGHSFPTCSPFPSSQESLSSVGFSGVPSAGQVLLPSSSSVDFLRRVQPRLGSFSSSLPCVRRLVSSGVSPSHQLAGASSSLSGPSELRDLIFGQSILIRSDNSTVVSYINHQGGTRSPSLCNLTLDLWDWCRERGIYLSASHVPGEDNLLADFLSRGKFLPSEWTLNHSVFQRICLAFPPPEIDLFASAQTFQLPKYFSRVQDPQAWAIDAMSFPWPGLRLFAFPPFSLLPRVLQKVAQDEADLLLIAPHWPQRPWVSLPSVATGGFSEKPSASPGPSSSSYLPLPTPSSGSSASFTLAAFRKRGQEAGLSERAADFAAQSLWPSTRCSYDARLAGFLKWCSQSACDPYTASLGSIADFLVSLLTRILLYPLSEATVRPLLPSMQVFLMALQFLIPPSSPGS